MDPSQVLDLLSDFKIQFDSQLDQIVNVIKLSDLPSLSPVSKCSSPIKEDHNPPLLIDLNCKGETDDLLSILSETYYIHCNYTMYNIQYL